MDLLIKVFLPLSLVFIMFSLGLGLTSADFLRVLKRPTAFLVGALNQLILLPLMTFCVILFFGISGELAVGFMILAACPGGVTSNLMARLANADVALSVSLTAIISLTSVLTVPLLLAFAHRYFIADAASPFSITGTAVTMFVLTVVPIVLAFVARSLFPNAMANAQSGLSKIAVALFVIIVIAALATNWKLFIANVNVLGSALITLLVLLLTIGYIVPRLMRRSVLEAKTVSIETGIQNSSLGIAVASLIVGSDAGFTAYSIPAAVYGIIMYLALLPTLLWFRHIGEPAASNP